MSGLPDSEELLDTIAKIRIRMKTEGAKDAKKRGYMTYIVYMAKYFPEFEEKYPTLFKKILQEEDIDKLGSMLDMIDRMRNQTIARENAEKILGEQLAEEYVYPVLGKPE